MIPMSRNFAVVMAFGDGNSGSLAVFAFAQIRLGRDLIQPTLAVQPCRGVRDELAAVAQPLLAGHLRCDSFQNFAAQNRIRRDFKPRLFRRSLADLSWIGGPKLRKASWWFFFPLLKFRRYFFTVVCSLVFPALFCVPDNCIFCVIDDVPTPSTVRVYQHYATTFFSVIAAKWVRL